MHALGARKPSSRLLPKAPSARARTSSSLALRVDSLCLMTDVTGPQETEVDEVEASEIDLGFDSICDAYEFQLEALADLANALPASARELDDPERVAESLPKSHIPEAKQREIGELIGRHAAASSPVSEVMRELVDRFIAEPWGSSLLHAFHQIVTRSPRLPILLQSLLTAAVGAFEAHLASVTSQFYRAAPQALEAVAREKEKEFSLRDLKRMNTIEEAVDVAIASRVDELLFKGYADWKRFYEERCKIDFADVSLDWTRVQEVFERRHTIVHNGGRASRRYVREIGGDTKEGDELPVDEDYLLRAIDELLVLGYLLVGEVWRKFASQPHLISHNVRQISYRNLQRGRYAVTERFCNYGLRYPDDESDRNTHLTNLWLARKHQDGMDSIRDDVLAWDVSASSDRFRMAKACLLDDLDTAIPLLQSLLAAGEVSGQDILEWPLLAAVRDDSRFDQLADAVGASLAVSDTVFISPKGRVYHAPDCSRRGARAQPVEASEAVGRGARPCIACLS
ncbi:MAG: hypothetical protein QOF68_757 [Gaiellales bacterium]|nr:hypothetical protein [Gaiellales bacterium]